MLKYLISSTSFFSLILLMSACSTAKNEPVTQQTKVSFRFIGEHFEEHNNNTVKVFLVDSAKALKFTGQTTVTNGTFTIVASSAALPSTAYTLYIDAAFVAGQALDCTGDLDHFFSKTVTSPATGEGTVTLDHMMATDPAACEIIKTYL